MRVKAIYFSPTGTTEKIIESIVKGIGPEELDCIDLTKRDAIDRKGHAGIGKEDLVLVGAPVYGGFLYKDFRNYIKCINFNNRPVAIGLLYGNATVLCAKSEIVSLVQERNGRVIGYGDFVGEHSFSTREIPVAIGRPDTDDLNTAFLFGKDLRNALERAHATQCDQHMRLLGTCIGQVADMKPLHTGKRFFSVPRTERELCNRCGVCIKKCPRACIDQEFRTDGNECIVCMACVKACHSNARATKAKSPLVSYGLRLMNRRKNESSFTVW